MCKVFCFLFVVGLSPLIFMGAANADLVTPSDRVTSRLNVRAGPSTDDAVIGKLEPGQTARFLSSVPFWYEVRLHTGVVGFVSKAWSERIEEAAAESLRIGAWNIKKLGHGSRKDFATVTAIIEDNFDILAIVEVMQKQQGHPGYDQLRAELGDAWEGVVTATPRPNDPSDPNAEFYAVVWRDSAADLCDGWSGLRYHVDGDGSPPSTAEDLFSREPAFVCLAVSGSNGAVVTDFLLAPYHAVWGSGDEEDIADEVEELVDVFAAMAQVQPGEQDLLIIGDFNLGSESLTATIAHADRTEGTGSTLNLTGARTANLYDHLVVNSESASSELVGNAVVLDVRDRAATRRQFYTTVSDHLPIVMQWAIPSQDDD